MTNMSKKRDEVMVKTRHSSIEMADSEAIKEKKKQDMLTKARNKFFDALKSRNIEGDQKKSRTQATIDYLFKPCPNSNKNDKNQVISNAQAQQNGHGLKRASSLQKQHSVGSYPIKIDVTDDDDPHGISRQRPATVCVDKIQDEGRETAALALERPRKKLSFREPEIMGYAIQLNRETLPRKCGRKAFTPEMKRSFSNNVAMKKIPSVDLDDLDLESQAMRIVRTVGQAFEVCHKLSITAPETEHLDYDEQETLTQDLVSDRLSDVTSDKPKKDLISECASDKISLPDEKENSPTENKNNRSFHLDLLSPPSNPNNNNNSSRKSPMTSGESYASPHSDGFPAGGGTGSCNSSIPATTGSALSAHHEIQLLREQLEQQSQQTQAALAQLQLAREQLAAEQSARLEAQARTHQLLVHNRELLDHIAALVAHLQGGEKGTHQPQTSPHVTMPQQQQFQGLGGEGCYANDHQEQPSDHSMLQALGLNPQGLIENRAVTSCLPSSPLRTTFSPSGGVFTFPHPQTDFSLEAQLLQRLQSLCGYTPPQYPYNLNQNIPFLPNLYAQPMVNNNYTLQPPPQKKLPPSPLAVRHSYTGSPILEKRVSPGKNDSLQNLNYQSQQNLVMQQQYQLQPNFGQNYQSNSNSNLSQNYQSTPNVNQAYQSNSNVNQNYQSNQNLNQTQQQNSQHLQVQNNVQQRQSPQRNVSPKSDVKSEQLFIKPLSQMGTLTTTDTDGRVRVIVPVPASDEASGMMSSLRINDDFRPNVPAITRSTSEKVPNRSELMSQVQRTAWARHTTK